MTYTLKLKPKPPKVWIGIPTGPGKEYAFLYMLAAVGDIDYNPKYIKITFALTDLGDEESKQFIKRARNLVENANYMFETEIIVTKPTEHQKQQWQAYANIMRNMLALRRKFLKEGYDYMWVLGGDNPPPRNTLKRLLALDADIASALIYQRPLKDYLGVGSWPMVFQHRWELKHLEHNGLNPEQKRILRKAWQEVGFHKIVTENPNWKRLKVLRGAVFGDGCCLIKRRVLEKIIYRIITRAYLSQDLQFCQDALVAGFTTAVDMKLHCPHLCVDGKAY